MVLRTAALALALALFGVARADPATTRDALDRLDEVLQLRVEDGLLKPEELSPAIIVSTQPRYEASAPWYATRAIEVLERSFGSGNLRLCEACMAPRTFVADGQLEYQAGPATLQDIVRLDEQSRGTSQPARAAIWLDEHQGGVSIRIVDLRTARVVFAQNVDPMLIEYRNTERMYTLSEELERRARGQSLTQAFVDFAIYPGQHISLDWTDQWGRTNQNLSGFTLSIVDPVLGLGGCHYRIIDGIDVTVGGKVLMSLPTALVSSIGEDFDSDILSPLITVAGVARIPFGRSNYGAVMSISTNGQIGIGLSLMNISALPVLP